MKLFLSKNVKFRVLKHAEFLLSEWKTCIKSSDNPWDYRIQKQTLRDGLQSLKSVGLIKDYDLNKGITI